MTLDRLASTVLPWRWESPAELRDEIDEEIRFHLEQRVRQLEADGLPEDEARARAEAIFGDIERTTLDCLTIQMRERIMLQKIQWVVIGVLVIGLIVLGSSYMTTVARQRAMVDEFRAVAEVQEQALEQARKRNEEAASGSARTLEEVTADWRARFEVKPDDWRHGLVTAKALVAQLEPDEAVRVLTDLWPEVSDTHKLQALKAFAFEHGHPETLVVMNLGATADALEVQSRAFHYLKDYAFRSFVDDYQTYPAWYERWNGTPLDQVLVENAREFVAKLHGKQPEELVDELRDFGGLDFRSGENLGVDLAEVFRDAGALALLESWLASGDEDAIHRAYSWAASLEADETWLRGHVLPGLDGDDPEVIARAVRALGQKRNTWAVPELVAYLERIELVAGEDLAGSAIFAAAGGLAEIGDPSVIPTLIGLIAANPGYDTIYGIGYYGLGRLTGVSYDESHDGTWWIDWWGKNLGRFPTQVRSIPIPDYERR